jgi:hypothetical protein
LGWCMVAISKPEPEEVSVVGGRVLGARPFRTALLVPHPLCSGPLYPQQEYREL